LCNGLRTLQGSLQFPAKEQLMTDLDASAGNRAGSAPATETEIAGAPAPILAPLAGDPAMLGLPAFIVGSVALGLVLVGVVPASAVGASLPIILAATSIGLLVATVWAAAIGQSVVASIFGVFAGFWLSYAVLVLGLVHGWFAITLTAAISTQELFLISWLVVIVLLTVATVRLPLAFTAILGLVDVALLLVLLGTEEASTSLLKAGGYVALAFAAVGVYVFMGAASLSTGGKAVPLGKPLMH
jgi:succinate-acetate transporter protein